MTYNSMCILLLIAYIFQILSIELIKCLLHYYNLSKMGRTLHLDDKFRAILCPRVKKILE